MAETNLNLIEHKSSLLLFLYLQILLFLNIFDFGFSLPKLVDKNLLNVINKLEGKVQNLDNVKSNTHSNSLSEKFDVKKITDINAKPRHKNVLRKLTPSNCGEKFFKEIFYMIF